MAKKLTLTVLSAALMWAALAALGGCADEPYRAGFYAAEETVRDLTVDVTDRTVELLPSADDTFTVEYYESDTEYYDIDLAGSALTINLVYDKAPGDYFGLKGHKDERVIRVYAPVASLASVTVTTTNGNIAADALSVTERCALSVNNGDVLLKDVGVGRELSMKAKNGDVRGTVRGSHDAFAMSIAIKKGKSNLIDKEGGGKTLRADINNGDLEIAFIAD